MLLYRCLRGGFRAAPGSSYRLDLHTLCQPGFFLLLVATVGAVLSPLYDPVLRPCLSARSRGLRLALAVGSPGSPAGHQLLQQRRGQ